MSRYVCISFGASIKWVFEHSRQIHVNKNDIRDDV